MHFFRRNDINFVHFLIHLKWISPSEKSETTHFRFGRKSINRPSQSNRRRIETITNTRWSYLCTTWWRQYGRPPPLKITKCRKRPRLTMWMGQLNSDQQRPNAGANQIGRLFLHYVMGNTSRDIHFVVFTKFEFKIRNRFFFMGTNLYRPRDCRLLVNWFHDWTQKIQQKRTDGCAISRLTADRFRDVLNCGTETSNLTVAPQPEPLSFFQLIIDLWVSSAAHR